MFMLVTDTECPVASESPVGNGFNLAANYTVSPMITVEKCNKCNEQVLCRIQGHSYQFSLERDHSNHLDFILRLMCEHGKQFRAGRLWINNKTFSALCQ